MLAVMRNADMNTLLDWTIAIVGLSMMGCGYYLLVLAFFERAAQ